MLKSALIRMIYLAIMFLANLVFSNLVLPERFGTVSLLILNAALLSIITGFGMDSIVLHKVSNNIWNNSKAVQFTWRVITIQFILFWVLELGSLQIWNKTLLSNERHSYLVIEAIYFTGLLLVEKYLALLYSFQKSLIANVALFVIGLAYFISLLLFYYFIKADFITVIYFFAWQSLAQGLILIFIFHVTTNPAADKENLNNKEFVAALKLSSVVMITNIIQLIAYRVDFWILQYFYGNYEVGIYAQANKFANLVWIVPNILAQLLIPKFALAAKNELPKIFSGGFYFNLSGIMASVVCANVFYFFYLNAEYRTGLTAFYLMLPGYFFWAGVIYFGAYFSWAGKFSYNLICSSCCFALILIADLILIPRFGLEGAAWANTIAYTAVFILYIFILIKKYSFKWNELLLLRKKDLSTIIKFITR